MIRAGDTIENPIPGERVTFTVGDEVIEASAGQCAAQVRELRHRSAPPNQYPRERKVRYRVARRLTRPPFVGTSLEGFAGAELRAAGHERHLVQRAGEQAPSAGGQLLDQSRDRRTRGRRRRRRRQPVGKPALTLSWHTTAITTALN
jgi:hypothetical protein